MRHLFNIIIVLTAVFSLLPAQSYAQRKAKKKVQKPAPVVVEPTKEELNFADLLSSTANVTFIDSVVVSKKAVKDSLFLSKASGTIGIEGKDSTATYSYTNELNNYRITSLVDTTGLHRLYISTKVGNSWSEHQLIEIPGDFRDIICPFLLSDGTTLYFSAIDGEGNVGRHDIFFTIYDSDEEAFITPQSLGLPYNSSDDDYYYIIDETENLGYLLTNRRQEADNVCIYTFIPTETRELLSFSDDDETRLIRYAILNAIADTQNDKGAVDEARQRLEKVRSKTKKNDSTFSFFITKNIVYHTIKDFKSNVGKDNISAYIKRKNTLAEDIARLSSLRKNFRKGQSYTASEIQNLETNIESERNQLISLEYKIRKAEQEHVKQ